MIPPSSSRTFRLTTASSGSVMRLEGRRLSVAGVLDDRRVLGELVGRIAGDDVADHELLGLGVAVEVDGLHPLREPEGGRGEGQAGGGEKSDGANPHGRRG